jgi:hypothetical protein
MDAALQVCAVMPATRNAEEQTTVTAATAPLNPQAREFVPAVVGATATAALNPLAKEFVPVGGVALNPHAMEFVPVGSPALNPLAMEFVPQWHVGGGLSADAPEFVMSTPPPDLYYHYQHQAPMVFGFPAADGYNIGSVIPPNTWRRVTETTV